MADKPERTSFLSDYAKTVITLGSALLALAVTFSDKVVSPTSPDWVGHVLQTLWVTLVLACFGALWMVAYLTSFLRLNEQMDVQKAIADSSASTAPDKATANEKLNDLRGKSDAADGRLSKGTDFSYWMLGISLILIVVLGFAPRTDNLESAKIVARAKKEIAQMRNIQPDRLTLVVLKRSHDSECYCLVFSVPGNTNRFQVKIDAKDGRIRELREVSDPEGRKSRLCNRIESFEMNNEPQGWY